MARAHAHILTAIWSDPDWVALTKDAQRLYLLLLSQPKLNMVGLLDVLPARWARLANDSTPDSIRQDLDDLEHAGFILVDHNTDELVIRTLVRHDATPAKTANPRWLAGVWRGWEAIESRMLRDAIATEIPDAVWESPKIQPPAEAQNTRSGQKLLPETSKERSKESSNGTSQQNVPHSPLSTLHSTPLSSSNYSHRADDTPDDDEQQQQPPDPRVETALAILAERDLEARRAAKGNVGDPDSWTRAAIERRRSSHGAALAEHAAGSPTATPAQLAAIVDPQHQAPAPDDRPHPPDIADIIDVPWDPPPLERKAEVIAAAKAALRGEPHTQEQP